MNIEDYPLPLFALSFVVFALSAKFGALYRKRRSPEEGVGEDFGIVVGATLTLLALIIGFTFSMALTRYDQRKNYEEAEANAIGTEYVRADLLPAADAEKMRALLRNYLDQRILFYQSRSVQQIRQIDARTAKLQAGLWSVVLAPAATQPTPPIALVVSGMNDVLNSQGYTQAAWWNRIPGAAWIFMTIMAICANTLVGYGAKNAPNKSRLLWVLPLVVSIAFLLIADIDSPRSGVIRVTPQNLLSLSESLPAQ
jgi:uncharacterized membrane protein